MAHVTRETTLSEAHERVCAARDGVIEAVRNWHRHGASEAVLATAYRKLCLAEAALRDAERRHR